jgi:hypothetical protein
MAAQTLDTGQVRAVRPVLADGGHISVQTAASGATWTPFGAQMAYQLTIGNDTTTDLEFRQGAAGTVFFPVFDGTYYTFFGINDCSELYVRRVDQSNTQVTVKARWEF